jgi:hypothetical protein
VGSSEYDSDWDWSDNGQLLRGGGGDQKDGKGQQSVTRLQKVQAGVVSVGEPNLLGNSLVEQNNRVNHAHPKSLAVCDVIRGDSDRTEKVDGMLGDVPSTPSGHLVTAGGVGDQVGPELERSMKGVGSQGSRPRVLRTRGGDRLVDGPHVDNWAGPVLEGGVVNTSTSLGPIGLDSNSSGDPGSNADVSNNGKEAGPAHLLVSVTSD